jgi:transposase
MRLDARAKKIGLYYFDESGFSNIPNVQRAWSPIGQTHAADASVSRARTNVIGALNFGENQLIFETQSHSVRREDVIAFFDQLAAQCPKDRINFCVLDNASIHRNIPDEIQEKWLLQRFVLLHIPPYSPELNLIEILWKQAKFHWRNFSTWARNQVTEKVRELLNEYGKKFDICFG